MWSTFFRGYYPKGGGQVRATVRPVTQLKAVTMLDRGLLSRIWGQAFVAGALPIKVMVLRCCKNEINVK